MKKGAKLTIVAVAVVAVCGFAALFFGAWGFASKPAGGQHLDNVDWLPASASDISFYRNGDSIFPMYCYECTMTYENVIEFAAKEGWRLTEKSPAILFGRDLLHLPKVKFKESDYDEAYESALEYKTEQSNGGGIHVVYHRPSSRLFVYYSAN